jgi:hypothetical protein
VERVDDVVRQVLDVMERVADVAQGVNEIVFGRARLSSGSKRLRLRQGFEGAHEFQITSFLEIHGDEMQDFAEEVDAVTFEPFNRLDSPEDAYGALCIYLDAQLSELIGQIKLRRA